MLTLSLHPFLTDNKLDHPSAFRPPTLNPRRYRESIASRPPLEMFEFTNYKSSIPVTYRCSVAVIGIGGIPAPPEKRRFHTCVS